MKSFLESDKIEKGKHKLPDKVNEVPVQPDFLHHFIVATAFIHAGEGIVKDQKVKAHATEHVKSVETCDEKEKCGKIRGATNIV